MSAVLDFVIIERMEQRKKMKLQSVNTNNVIYGSETSSNACWMDGMLRFLRYSTVQNAHNYRNYTPQLNLHIQNNQYTYSVTSTQHDHTLSHVNISNHQYSQYMLAHIYH